MVWEKYVIVRHATYDNVIRCMRYACWITKATDTLSEHVILMLSHGNKGYGKESQYYVLSYNGCLVSSLLSHLLRFKLPCSRPWTHNTDHFSVPYSNMHVRRWPTKTSVWHVSTVSLSLRLQMFNRSSVSFNLQFSMRRRSTTACLSCCI